MTTLRLYTCPSCYFRFWAANSELARRILIAHRSYCLAGALAAVACIHHATSLSDAASLCGNRYDIVAPDASILDTPEKRDFCKGIAQTPCVLLVLNRQTYGHVVEPAKGNLVQVVVRGQASAGVFAAAIRYIMRIRESTRACGTLE